MPASESVTGAFTLGAPGTYVAEAGDALVIGNRAGPVQYSIAILVPAGCLALLWLVRDTAWWIGAGALVLFGLPASLVAFNSQRYEITKGKVAMRGRAAGIVVRRDWRLPADSAVRIATRLETDEGSSQWTIHQAQILTDRGWISLAESLERRCALEFAERLARAADVGISEARG